MLNFGFAVEPVLNLLIEICPFAVALSVGLPLLFILIRRAQWRANITTYHDEQRQLERRKQNSAYKGGKTML